MVLVTHDRMFGARKAYTPADEPSDFDERRAELDWQYLSGRAEVLDAILRLVQKSVEEIPRHVRAVRKLPMIERRRSPMVLDLHDLIAELVKSNGVLKARATDFAKLIAEIEDRIAYAQRYAAEHALHKIKPRQ